MKALVLSSGGIDSTTCVAWAIDKYGKNNVCTLSFEYGQKHSKELQCAKQVAEFYDIKNIVLDVSQIFKYSECCLLRQNAGGIPHTNYVEQAMQSKTGEVSTSVPFRNGLFLSCATVLARSLWHNEESTIVIGVHADDAAGNAYADCSGKFVRAISTAMSTGTYNMVQLEAPFTYCNKSQVIKTGLELGAPYQFTWSCYEGGDKPCGICATCRDRAAAFELNGVVDPALI